MSKLTIICAALCTILAITRSAAGATPTSYPVLSGPSVASLGSAGPAAGPSFGVRSRRRQRAYVPPECQDDAGIFGDERWDDANGSMAPPRLHDSVVAARRRVPVDRAVQMCSIGQNLVRGALLRIASDLSGGTPLENVKCRVTVSKDRPIDACRSIVREGGIANLWSGTPSRTVEGALMGAMFLVGATFTKKRVVDLTGSQTLGALAGGCVGGVLQAIVMTPAGVVFTSLNVNKGTAGYENDNALTVTRRIVREKGLRGLMIGGGPMAARQASNWASRSVFTELARTRMGLQGSVMGEIASGAIGGLGSCWNTPIETCRVYMHRDVARGGEPKKFVEYWNEIKEKGGYPGLFRGVTPRAVQAIWQTVFMVVVPNLLGI